MKYLKIFEIINHNNDRLFTKDDFYCIMDRFQDIIDEWSIEFDNRVLGQPRTNQLRYHFNFSTMGNILNPIKGKELTVDDCHNIYLTICYPKAYFFKLSNDLTKYEQFTKEINDFIKLMNDINPTWEIIKKDNFATDSAMIVIKFKKYSSIGMKNRLRRFNESDEFHTNTNLKVSDDDLYEIEYIFRSEVLDNIDSINFQQLSIEDLRNGVPITPNSMVQYTIYRYEKERPDNTLVGNRQDRIGIIISFGAGSVLNKNQNSDYNKYIQNFVNIVSANGWILSGEFLLKPLAIYIVHRKQFNLSKS